jgi:hypothetical protein
MIAKQSVVHSICRSIMLMQVPTVKSRVYGNHGRKQSRDDRRVFLAVVVSKVGRPNLGCVPLRGDKSGVFIDVNHVDLMRRVFVSIVI